MEVLLCTGIFFCGPSTMDSSTNWFLALKIWALAVLKFFDLVLKFEPPNARFLNFPKNSAPVLIRLVLINGEPAFYKNWNCSEFSMKGIDFSTFGAFWSVHIFSKTLKDNPFNVLKTTKSELSRNTNNPFRWFWILTVRVYPMFFHGNCIFQNSWL